MVYRIRRKIKGGVIMGREMRTGRPEKCIICGKANEDYAYWDKCSKECADKLVFILKGTRIICGKLGVH